MPSTDILSIIEEQIGEEKLSSDTLLETLGGWNSLAVIGMISKLDKRLGIQLNPGLLASCKTVGDVISTVESLSDQTLD